MKAQVNVAGNTKHLVSIALQKEANATLVMSKQKTVLFPNACGQSSKILLCILRTACLQKHH